MRNFDGRTAVITGAASGIGRALARHAASMGMAVVAADIDAAELAGTVEALRGDGAEVTAVPTDVSDPDAVWHLADVAFERHGEVHLLCNNAGVFAGGLLWERPVVDFEWVMDVNLFAIVHAVRAFVPRMLDQRHEAHIVNTASMGGLVTNAFSGPYYTSKFAVVGLTECLAHDLAAVRSRIGVSLLVPGLVATGIGYSDRHRPTRYRDPNHPEPGEDADYVTRALRERTAIGTTPDQVAQQVFDAVVEGRFYIPTNPSFDRQLVERHEDQLARRLPRPPELD